MPRLTITFHGRRSEIEVPADRPLDEIILGAGYLIERQCAGRGKCGRCKLIVRGETSALSIEERESLGDDAISAGWRLACRAAIAGRAEVELESGIVHSDKIIGAIPKDGELPRHLGLALDLGTTTVGAFLVDLYTGRIIAGNAALNRQSSFGADVISRLERSEDDGAIFSGLARQSLAEAVEGLKLGEAWKRVEKAVVVGNTAMHHMLLGLPTDRLRVRPFEPTSVEIVRGVDFLERPEISQSVPPVIGGFVGSDTLACLSYFGFDKPGAQPAMATDLGTNGEVMLTDGKRIIVASTAAGPAFEGVNISRGMRASPGAVVRAGWKDNRIILETIDDAPPLGIAGSGLLSVIRLLREKGLIEASGRIIDPSDDRLNLVGRNEDGKFIVLADGLCITQGDIREFQKAKGAVRACAEALLNELGMSAADLKKVYLTGSFGGRLDIADVLELGVLPWVDPMRIISIPNGAGLGAALFLKDEEFEMAAALAKRVEHLALFDSEAFLGLYISNMGLCSGSTDVSKLSMI